MGGFLEEKKINGYDVVMLPLDKELDELMEKVLSKEYQTRLEEAKKLLGETSKVSFWGRR